jgi:thiol-disulfide isomerase/thioredoxin
LPDRFRHRIDPGMRLTIISAATFALAACHQASTQQPAANQAADVEVKGIHRDFKGKAAPEAIFDDPDGKPVKLADFKGKPLLVNLWATWCAPCVKELPTLDQLARTGAVQVLAISQDDGPHASVVAFLQGHQIGTLEPYQDPKTALSSALGPDTVLPTSILFDARGKEVWRYVGDFDWTSPEAAKLLAEAGAAKKTG